MKFLPARVARLGARTARGSWIVLALVLASCSTNESGRIAATGTGDISNPPVTRIAPVANGAACANLPGEGAGQTAIARAPYLQRVTAHEAVVVWTSVAGASASVLVETPDGNGEVDFSATIDPGEPSNGARQWSAALTGLQPDTTYCYTVYQDGAPVSAPTPLETAPVPEAARPFQFVAFGDSGGGGNDQRALLQQLETVPFDLMIHTGDIAYDHGTLADFEAKFFGMYAPLLAARPMFPASGNHDYETSDAAPFRQVYVLPENGGPDGIERWYSYDWGDVHLVALDTEKVGPAQAAWLEADLTANKLPWTVVYGHRPPHSSGEHGDDPGFNQYLVPILKAHHVPLVLAGHDHHYERFKPIDGTTYIVTGGGGRGVRELNNRESSSAFAEAVIHFVAVTVDADTLAVHAIDGTGREFDSTVIRRG